MFTRNIYLIYNCSISFLSICSFQISFSFDGLDLDLHVITFLWFDLGKPLGRSVVLIMASTVDQMFISFLDWLEPISLTAVKSTLSIVESNRWWDRLINCGPSLSRKWSAAWSFFSITVYTLDVDCSIRQYQSLWDWFPLQTNSFVKHLKNAWYFETNNPMWATNWNLQK